MTRYNLYRCCDCGTLVADPGKPQNCSACETQTGGYGRASNFERIEPREDLGVLPETMLGPLTDA